MFHWFPSISSGVIPLPTNSVLNATFACPFSHYRVNFIIFGLVYVRFRFQRIYHVPARSKPFHLFIDIVYRDRTSHPLGQPRGVDTRSLHLVQHFSLTYPPCQQLELSICLPLPDQLTLDNVNSYLVPLLHEGLCCPYLVLRDPDGRLPPARLRNHLFCIQLPI